MISPNFKKLRSPKHSFRLSWLPKLRITTGFCPSFKNLGEKNRHQKRINQVRVKIFEGLHTTTISTAPVLEEEVEEEPHNLICFLLTRLSSMERWHLPRNVSPSLRTGILGEDSYLGMGTRKPIVAGVCCVIANRSTFYQTNQTQWREKWQLSPLNVGRWKNGRTY